MEEKKLLVLQILDKLKWFWVKAEELSAMVKSTYCTDEILDSLIKFIDEAVQYTKNDIEKQAFKNSVLQLQKIKQLEEKQKDSDENIDMILKDI